MHACRNRVLDVSPHAYRVPMPLDPEQYLEHLRAESALFRTAATASDPAARVPSCPDWSATDLLWHLGEVQWLWWKAVQDRPTQPDESATPPRPEAWEDVLAFFDDSHA